MSVSFVRRTVAAVLCAGLCLPLFSGCSKVVYTDAVISELMADNSVTLADESGLYPDWLELYNPTSRDIDLEGYGLSDNPNLPYKYTLPSVTLKRKSYLVLFMDGENRVADSGEIHTSFKLSSAGDETILFTSPSGKQLSSVTPAACPADVSVGLVIDSKSADYGSYAYFSTPTPGKENGGTYSVTAPGLGGNDDPDKAPVMMLYISEYMKKNTVLLDSEGDYSPWAELWNPGEAEVAIGGCYLSDDPSEPDKWQFPEGTFVPAGGYLTVYLSGKDKVTEEGHIHASFKLSSSDKALLLSDKMMQTVHRVTLVSLTSTASYGLEKVPENGEESWLYYPRPTPGKANTTPGFSELGMGTAVPTDTVYLSEVASVNKDDFKNPAGEYMDWVELCNPTEEAIDLSGWYLSDDPDNPRFFEFPSGTTVAAGGTRLCYADGDGSGKGKGEIYLPFSLSAEGDTLLLTNADGVTVDVFSTGRGRRGMSAGRSGSNPGERLFFDTPTPGETNGDEGSTGFTAAPVFSSDGGCMEGTSLTLTITAPEGATVYYTLDGSEPTEKSHVYRNPLHLTDNTAVRAVAKLPSKAVSDPVTRTFLFGETHDLPVVCLSSAPEGLFSESRGMLATGYGASAEYPHQGANYWKDWERPIGFEFYTEEGDLGVTFNAGLKVAGQYSRAQAQKSLKVVLRGEYGTSSVTYPFFKDYDVSTFKSFILRTSGQDWNSLKLRDAFFAQVAKGQMDLDYMEYRFCALYINGEYWGLYCIREHTNADYIEAHTGLDADKVDLIKGNKSVKAGSKAAYEELYEYVKTHDLSVQKNFDYVAARVDMEEWANWWIVETFFSNTDTGNIKFYCGQDGTGKWRWILFDLDWGMFPSTYHRNRLDRMLDPKGHGTGSMFSSLFARKFMENEGFRTYFIETYAQHLNTTFDPERMYGILDSMAAEIRTEIPRNHERWEALSPSAWERNLNRMKEMLAERVELSKEHLQDTFNLSVAQMKELFPDS